MKSFDSKRRYKNRYVLIVGAGMAGILCGYFIKQK